MTKQPTPEQSRRRRRAALELRRRAADLLDQAHRLDGDPAMRVLRSDLERVAAHLGISIDDLVTAVTALWPRHPDHPNSQEEGEAMTYEKTTYGRLPTPWGDLLVWCNGHDDEHGYTVGLRTEWEHNRHGQQPEGGWDGMPETITIHRVAYGVNAFMTIADDGTVESNDRSPLTRANGTAANSWPLASSPAVTKFWELVGPAVGAWAHTDKGRKILRARAYASVHNDLEYVEAAIAEAEAKLVALRGQGGRAGEAAQEVPDRPPLPPGSGSVSHRPDLEGRRP